MKLLLTGRADVIYLESYIGFYLFQELYDLHPIIWNVLCVVYTCYVVDKQRFGMSVKKDEGAVI